MAHQTARATTEESGGARSDAILDAAEHVFAEAGYDGAALREIAQRAGVAQGLIHYHFTNKERLFERMVERRSGQINGARAARLDALRARGDVRLEEIVEALFRPTIETGLEMAGDMAGQGDGFARILVSMANSNNPLSREMTETYYDPIAKQFIAALKETEPGLSQADAVWAYMFAIGVGMSMMSKTGRPARLSGGLCDDGDADAMLDRIVPFICGGIHALSAQQKPWEET